MVDGETRNDDGRLTPAELDEKFRNIASIESALAGFWRPFGNRLLCPSRKSEILELKAHGIARSELVSESLPWLLDVLFGDLASMPGEGGVLDGRANMQPNLFACIMPNSISEPELISADTLFINRANVTFFSNFGSFRAAWAASFSLNLVSFVVRPALSDFFSPVSVTFRSLIWINSPKLTFRVFCFVLGDISCWSICFFSATFFFVGVELLRFFFGDGVPIC